MKILFWEGIVKMKPDIAKTLGLYNEADDLAKDWLIQSWSLKEEDKTIALAYYRKAYKKRAELAKRLNELCQIDNNNYD